MRKKFKKALSGIFAGLLAAAAVVSMSPVTAGATGVNPKARKIMKKNSKLNVDDPDYHAYFAFQTDPGFTFRNGWSQDYGLYQQDKVNEDKTNIFKDGGYFNKVLGWGTEANHNEGELIKLPGEFHDVEIKGNGTYTIGVTGLDGCLTDGKAIDAQEKYNLLFISTDIPASGKDKIKFTDVKVKIDGIEKSSDAATLMNPDTLEDPKSLDVLLINNWNGDIDKSLESSATMANDSIEITFTVSGFSKDDPDANGETLEASSSSASSGSSDASGDTAASSTSESSSSQSSSGGSSAPTIIIICIIVIIVVIIIVVSSKKKKKDDGAE